MQCSNKQTKLTNHNVYVCAHGHVLTYVCMCSGENENQRQTIALIRNSRLQKMN